MRVAIAGGGIGGMTLALSLLAAGITDVEVFESAPAIRALGLGINLLPHGARELTELGLVDELSAVGIPTTESAFYTRRGQLIWSEPCGLAAGYRWPQFSIHRGELLGVLHRAVVERLGSRHVHTSCHLARFGQSRAGGVWAEFVDRATDTPAGRAEADLLVGCDGVHSAARHALYPDEGAPRWNGITMYRGLTRAKPFLSGRTLVNVGSDERRVVAYSISKAEEERGRALINWSANFKAADEGTMPRESWSHTARAQDVVGRFASFVFDFLDVPALIAGAEVVYKYPQVDRDPLPTWDFGRVTLLGDAAHPMHPAGANGASQAILDARVLARELAGQPSIETAVAAYDAKRRPTTAAVVRANREKAQARSQNLVEERAPDGFTDLTDVIGQQELEQIFGGYERLAGFDRETLNSRPSLSACLLPLAGLTPAR